MKKIFFSVLLFISLFFSLSFSYKVELPHETTDVRHKEMVVDADDSKDFYKELAKKVNKYLWFFLGSVSLFVVVYAGFLIMSSNGNNEDLKKGNKMLVWGIVGIFVSLFAYIIVKLLMGLF